MLDNKLLTNIGTILVSILIVIGFIFVYYLAYANKDMSSVNTLNGIIAGAMGTVVGYWVGSSAGSRNKDESLDKYIKDDVKTDVTKQRQEVERGSPNFPRTPI